jgi:hypothetical protein
MNPNTTTPTHNEISATALFWYAPTKTFLVDASDLSGSFVEDPTEIGIWVRGRTETLHFEYKRSVRDSEGDLVFDEYASGDYRLQVAND